MNRSVVSFVHSRSFKSSIRACFAVCYHDGTVGVVVEINEEGWSFCACRRRIGPVRVDAIHFFESGEK